MQNKPTPKVPEKAPTPEPLQKPQPAKPSTNYPDPIINEKTVKHPKEQKLTKPGKPGEPEKDEDDPSLPKINVKTRNANDPDPDVPPIYEKTVRHPKKQPGKPGQPVQPGQEQEEDDEDLNLPKINVKTNPVLHSFYSI